jgi:LacI family transcriptional regulator
VSEQVTLADVARWAGVSLATASRALHGSQGRTVGPELRARVRAAAAELNYSPNANARAIVRGTTTTVGLVVHDIADPAAAAIASGVMAAANERDLIVTIGSTLSDPLTEIRHVEALRRQRARAIILAGSRSSDPGDAGSLADELIGYSVGGGHVAVIGQHLLPVNTIVIDNAGSAQRLARALVSLGYRRFAVLAGPESMITSEDRLNGFRQGLSDAGLEMPEENVIEAQFTRDGGYVAMMELLDREIEVEAVFAVNDVMAVGATAALRDQGYRVPQDMAVAGFDDISTLRDVRPALTTVRLPLIQMGRRALELALDGRKVAASRGDPDGEDTGQHVAVLVEVAGEVVVRDSTPARTRPGELSG